jgi:hypothetical protein
VNQPLSFLLSSAYTGALAPEHLANLRESGLSNETIARQRLCSVPPGMIPPLLGFDIPAIRSAMVLPFPDTRGGWMDHVRLKMFPSLTDRNGRATKYLQPRGSGVRLFFPLATLHEALYNSTPLWLVEGEKKSLAVAQLGLPAVGFCGINGWHSGGSQQLLPDFQAIDLRNRVVELVPDGDVATNPHVTSGAERFAEALEARGAQVRLVRLPLELAA